MQAKGRKVANSHRSESSMNPQSQAQSQQEKKKPGRPPKLAANAAMKSPKNAVPAQSEKSKESGYLTNDQFELMMKKLRAIENCEVIIDELEIKKATLEKERIAALAK